MFKRYSIVSFFALTYLITWPFQILALIIADRIGVSISNEDNFHHFTDLLTLNSTWDQLFPFLLYNVGQFGPAVAAFLVTALVYGRIGLRDLGGRMLRWCIQPRWYLTALFIPILLVVVSLGAAFVVGGFQLGPFLPKVSWVAIIPFFLFMVVFTGVAEEPGWRGFALPHLQARNSAIRSTWIVGILWGLWHLPFTVYFNREQPWALIPSLVGLTLGIVGWAIVLTWVYNGTQSVLLVILLHGWDNTVRSYLILSQPNFMAMTLYGLLPWAVAIFLAKRYGDENLGDAPRPKWWLGIYNTEQRAEGEVERPALPAQQAPVT